MTESKDIKVNLASNPEFRDGMIKVIQEISDLIIYKKKIKNNEPIPADLSKRMLDFNTRASVEYARSPDYEKEKINPNENSIIKTYQRFVQYDYSQPYTSESLDKLKNINYPIDFTFLIRTTYQYILNIDKSKIERKLQYYEKSYSFITTFVENHYKPKSQKLFKHYHRAALATYIVLELNLEQPSKPMPENGYTNDNLVEVSKNALKPVMKRF